MVILYLCGSEVLSLSPDISGSISGLTTLGSFNKEILCANGSILSSIIVLQTDIGYRFVLAIFRKKKIKKMYFTKFTLIHNGNKNNNNSLVV
jgi:hypothetical protein